MKQKNNFIKRCDVFWQIPKHYVFLSFILLLFGYDVMYAKELNNNDKLPGQTLLFEENKGQFETGIMFKALDRQAHYSFLKGAVNVSLPNLKNEMALAYQMKFLGANSSTSIKGEEKTINPQFGIRNYITEKGKISDVSFFKEILYEELWDRIDANFHNSMEGLKYDFIVKPGGNPGQIKVELNGVEKLKVNAKGELEFLTSHGKLLKGSPYTYQIIKGKKHTIKSKYKVENTTLSFELEAYDESYPLIIDPIALKYATVLGNGEVDYTINTSTLDASGSKIYFVATVDSLITDVARQLVNIGCMKADGTGVLWTTTLYSIGTGGGYESRSSALDIQINNMGDVFVLFRNSRPGYVGLNKSALILGPHPIYPANPSLGNPTSDDSYVLSRLSADGATLKYFTYIGATVNHDNISNLIVEGDIVTVAMRIFRFDAEYLNVIPPTVGAINTIANSSGTASSGSAVFRYNTAVAGKNSVERAAYFGNLRATRLKKDNNGNIIIVGRFDKNQSANYQPEWSANSILKYEDINDNSTVPFLMKTDYALSTILYATPVAVTHPEMSNIGTIAYGDVSVDIDKENNIIIGVGSLIYGNSTNIDLSLFNSSALKTNYFGASDQVLPVSAYARVCFLHKIPGNSLNTPAWLNIFKADYGINTIGTDGKNRIHAQFERSYANKPILTNGAFQEDPFDINYNYIQYLVFSKTGNLEYATVIGPTIRSQVSGGSTNVRFGSLSIDKTRNIAYNFLIYRASQTIPFTPSYWDYATGSQKIVAGLSNIKFLKLKDQSSLTVFHEPTFTNSITDFSSGANTFCVDGQIYQDPNSGPIVGNEPTFLSGNGSSATHNLPDVYRLGVRFAHPTPKSPKITLQWQKSTNSGSTWSNISGETKAVLKPEPASQAGTLQFRRLAISSDTIFSNVATATIAGSFNLQINGPTDPVYYCAAVPSQSLGVSITGASGNISWQWYDGFTPVGNTVINPSSGSGVAANTFTASVGSSLTKSGFYRLVVIDAGGCRKEYFATVQPLTAKAYATSTFSICPGGTGTVKLGPVGINPLFDYNWSGPSSFSSNLPNPVSSVGGKYFLTVKLKTQGSFCAGGIDSVDVIALTTHDAALVNIMTSKSYCEKDAINIIGLNNPAPATGYSYSWAPTKSLSQTNSFRATFNPKSPPFGVAPVDSIQYVFNATRTSDGCVFSDTLLVRDTIMAVADASQTPKNIEATSGCNDGTYLLAGGTNMTGNYFEWVATATTFPGGLSALLSNTSFGIDKLNNSKGNKSKAQIYYPQGSYDITFTLKASYFPINQTACFASETMTLRISCSVGGAGGGGSSCGLIAATNKGLNGACSQVGVEFQAPSPSIGDWNMVKWTTKQVNNVVQSTNTPPKGLFTTDGAALTTLVGNHPLKLKADIENSTLGWPSADSVIYQFEGASIIGGVTTETCTQEIKIYSARALAPKARLKDTIACLFPAVTSTQQSVRVTSNGKAELPYTISNSDYTTSPAGNIEYNWNPLSGGGSARTNNRYPILNPNLAGAASYQVSMRDSSTGCIALDTFSINVVNVEAKAGDDQLTGCQGAIVRLGRDSMVNFKYKWTPSSGLFYPLVAGTPNDSVAQPFTTVPSGTTAFQLLVTETTTGCQAMDLVTITSDNNAPTSFSNETLGGCNDKLLELKGPRGPWWSPYVIPAGATISWTATSGSANLSWLSSTNELDTKVQLPPSFTSAATFTLTISKGSCGSESATYTISPFSISLGADVTTACVNPLVQIGVANDADFQYVWFPKSGLYTDNAGTTPYASTSNSQVYARTAEDTDYNLVATHRATGCTLSDEIRVLAPTGLSINLGDDITYCPLNGSVPIVATGTGSNPTWTAIGYNADPKGNPFPISSAEATRAESYLTTTNTISTNFNPSVIVPGIYVYQLKLDNGSGSVCEIVDDIKVIVSDFKSGMAGGDVDMCEGQSTKIGFKTPLSSYDFKWKVISPSSSFNSLSNDTEQNPVVNPLVKTIYEAFYQDAVSGCSTTERIIVNALPALNINTLATSVACREISSLNVTSLVQRLDTVLEPKWYRDFVPSLEVSSPTSYSSNRKTTYYVVGKNQFGCIDTGSIVLDVEPVRKPVVLDTVVLAPKANTINLNNYLPFASSVPTGTLGWYTSITGAAGTEVTNPVQSSGTYYCIEKTALGCVSPAGRLAVVMPNPVLRAEFDCNTTCTNFETYLNLTLVNNNYFSATSGIGFNVTLPTGLTVGALTNASTCGGTLTANAGATTFSLTGGNLSAGNNCVISIPISGVVGTYSFTAAAVSVGTGLDNGITTPQSLSVTSTCAGQGPGKPGNVFVKTDGNISWVAPASIGSGPIVDYLIEYSTNGGTSWQTFNDGVSSDAKVYFGIVDPTMSYQFRISALNSFGAGCSAVTPVYSNLSNCTGPFACVGTINVKLNGDCSKTVSVKELLLPCGPIDYYVKVNDNNPTNGGIVDGISPVGGWLYGIFDQNGALVCQGKLIATDGSGPVMSANQLAAWNAIDTIVTWVDNVDEIYNVPSSWWGNNTGYSSIPLFGSKYYTGRPYMVDSCELAGLVTPSSDTWIIDADDNGQESTNDKWDIHRSRNLQIRVTDYLESTQSNGNGYQYLLRRTFQFTDQRGNSTFLNQIIYFQSPAPRGSYANRFEGIATPGANPQTPLDRGPGNLGQFGPFGSGPRKAHSSYGEADNKDLNKANIAAFSYATHLGADQMTTPYGMGGQTLRDTIVYDISNGNCYNFNAASEMKKLLTGLYVAVDTLPSGAKDSVSLFSEQLNGQYSAAFSYKEFSSCNNGKSYEVVTTVFDLSTGVQSFDTLIIQMVDKSAPVFAAERSALPILGSSSSNPIIVSVGTNDCTGSLRLGTASGMRDLSNLFNLKVSDNCSALTSVNLNYQFETANYWNQSYYVTQGFTVTNYTVVNTANGPSVMGLPIGQHKVTITANDGCNNQSTQVLYFDVVDKVAPVMKCDDALTVSLTSNSSSNYFIDGNKSDADVAKQMQARLYVADINEGSRDNCTLDSLYVRRQFNAATCLPYFQTNMEYDIYGLTPNGKVELNDFERVSPGSDLYYTPKFMQYVDFFCCDPSTVMVELWGSDASHYNNASAGNWNYCWTNVTIEDKTAPVITRPNLNATYNASATNWINCTEKEWLQGPDLPRTNITALFINNNVDNTVNGKIATVKSANDKFGMPDIYGIECSGEVFYEVKKKLTCDTGVILRIWDVVKDVKGVAVSVKDTQLIWVQASHDYTISVPADVTTDCPNLASTANAPTFDENGCDLLAMSVVKETIYNAAAADNACKKIYRTWTIINWCQVPNQFSCASADPMNYARVIPRLAQRTGSSTLWTYPEASATLPAAAQTHRFRKSNTNTSRDKGQGSLKYAQWLGAKGTDRAALGSDWPTSALSGAGTMGTQSTSTAWSGTSIGQYLASDIPSTGCTSSTGFGERTFAWSYTQVVKIQDATKPTIDTDATTGLKFKHADAGASDDVNWNATKKVFGIRGNGAEPTNPAINGTECQALVKFTFDVSDGCAASGPFNVEAGAYIVKKTGPLSTTKVADATVTPADPTQTNKTFAVSVDGLGIDVLTGKQEYQLVVSVRDDCGNVTTDRIDFTVADIKAPAPVCVQNLTVSLMPTNAGGSPNAGMTVIKAIDVFQDIYRNWENEECTPTVKAKIVRTSLDKVASAVDVLALNDTIQATCKDRGSITARVYLIDGAGNYNFCTITIQVEDNAGVCGGASSAAVAGAIQTESKATVEGVQVNLSGQSQKSFATGVNGLFVFNNLTAGADYTVTPSLNKGFLNGVSTFDLVLISKHILGVQPLNTPYKLIAADVNNSKSVTTLDLIQLRKLILNIDAAFANNSSWRFVEASYTFPNASNPWAASFPEVKNVNDLEGSLTANFVAVKVGDVNGSAIANSTQGSVRKLTSNLGINVADMNLVAGNEYKVDFTTADLNGVEGFQFTLNLDKKGLALVDLVPGIAAEENFGIFTEEGVVTASWNGEAKGGVLFSLVVRAKSNTTLSEVLNLNSRYTAAEAYKGGEVVNVGLNFNASKASANYALYQNTPNPFAGESIIGFNLPAAGTATLTIQDVTGRTLKVINGQYAKGYNQVTVKDRDLSTKGVLTYTLKVADFTMTKKMVIVE
jgi:hypothetical protein